MRTGAERAAGRASATRERGASDAERALWRRAMGLLPLEGAPVPPPPAAPPSAATPPLPPPTRRPPLSPAPAGVLDPRLSSRLKQGRAAIEARLDLHGMTQEEAHGKLAGFLARSIGKRHRLVLVITGKGQESQGRSGILRVLVPRWLCEPPHRSQIISIAPAHPRDGGAGALYVLLRRARSRDEFTGP